jgi:hypothetical protein
VLAAALCACGGGGASSPPPEEEGPPPDPDDPAYAARFDGTTDPRVSTSRGQPGGVVVLWPRVVTGPGADGAEATMVQNEMRAIAERVVDSTLLDVRPDPERACPHGGCEAASFGAVLLAREGGCAVVANVGQPGAVPTRLIAWAAEVDLRNHIVPFRDPPEQHIRVTEFVPCADLSTALVGGAPDVEQALREAVQPR